MKDSFNRYLTRQVAEMKDSFRMYLLAIKYWFVGDSWEFAVSYARALVKGWSKPRERK